MTDELGNLGLDTAVPEGVRALAEKTVAQTREAYERSADAFEVSLTTFERTLDAAGQGAAAFNRKIIDLTQRNVNSVFDLAKSLAGARTRRHRGVAGGLLAQAVRRPKDPSRRSASVVDEGDGRCGQADQVANGARRGWGGEDALKSRCRA